MNLSLSAPPMRYHISAAAQYAETTSNRKDRTMSDTATARRGTTISKTLDMKLEVVVIPVSNVDRAKAFYGGLGWRLDADFVVGDTFRVVQFTPPGSPSSIHFGTGLTTAAPGSARGLYLVVSDIEAVRADLVGHGAGVSEVFHRAGPGQPAITGRDPERRSYVSYATFSDPDGNGWLLQEVTERLPGRVDPDKTTFTSSTDLAAALRRAADAHGEHEKRDGGRHDENWPDWYAAYMVAEQAGKPLPL
ncbi:glyoxalase [Labrys miyagiensis]|uniref:Glyoxalase n=2 Tax=Labrys miyagiensis TaxID=346912 RepID=A0ABQ6CKP2_9HYPH|nr:glyoxalase [Labrys miyagiensis]